MTVHKERPMCECGHRCDEHFNMDGSCCHQYNEDERCDCEDYMPTKDHSPRNPESLPDWAENYLSDGKKWNKEHEKKKEEAKK